MCFAPPNWCWHRTKRKAFLENSHRSRPRGCSDERGRRRNANAAAYGAVVKQGICPALILTFGFLCATTPACCQQAFPPSTDSNVAGLPDTPSESQRTTCTQNNGKPCPELVHKMIGQYPPVPESEMLRPERDPSSVHLWTYRGWQDPPLRTNREVFRSKVFVATHVGGAIAMIVACRSRNSREGWGSEVPAVAAMFGMDYLQFRFVGGPNAVAPAVYEMIHYGRASTR